MANKNKSRNNISPGEERLDIVQKFADIDIAGHIPERSAAGNHPFRRTVRARFVISRRGAAAPARYAVCRGVQASGLRKGWICRLWIVRVSMMPKETSGICLW